MGEGLEEAEAAKRQASSARAHPTRPSLSNLAEGLEASSAAPVLLGLSNPAEGPEASSAELALLSLSNPAEGQEAEEAGPELENWK